MVSELSVEYRCGVFKQNPISVSVAEFGKKLLSENESPIKGKIVTSLQSTAIVQDTLCCFLIAS